MKNNEVVRIAIEETSVIIRGGLTAALKRLSNVKVQPIELLSVEALHDCVRTQCPEMLIVNPPRIITEVSAIAIRTTSLFFIFPHPPFQVQNSRFIECCF